MAAERRKAAAAGRSDQRPARRPSDRGGPARRRRSAGVRQPGRGRLSARGARASTRGSRVLEIDPTSQKIVWQVRRRGLHGAAGWTFYSSFISSARRAAQRQHPDRRRHERPVLPGHAHRRDRLGIRQPLFRSRRRWAAWAAMVLSNWVYRAQPVPYDWAPDGTPHAETPVTAPEPGVSTRRPRNHERDAQASFIAAAAAAALPARPPPPPHCGGRDASMPPSPVPSGRGWRSRRRTSAGFKGWTAFSVGRSWVVQPPPRAPIRLAVVCKLQGAGLHRGLGGGQGGLLGDDDVEVGDDAPDEELLGQGQTRAFARWFRLGGRETAMGLRSLLVNMG